VTTTLRPMNGDELARFVVAVRDGYAKEIAEWGGFEPEFARRKAEEDTAALFPGGEPAEGNSVYVVEADGEAVGQLWVADRDREGRRLLWIYFVGVDDAHRGRGHGREAMLLCEAEARRRGIDRVELNVFGGNAAARGLYRSLGYDEMAVSMGKDV
jgi:ribosomal protein S18 acetylase RimI-like enzyme